MRAVLDHCTGGTERQVNAGTSVVTEGGTSSGHLYVLVEGKLDVLKSDTVVATITEPGAVFGEMSVLLGLPHTATVRASSDSVIYEFEDAASFLIQKPEVALLLARKSMGGFEKVWEVQNGIYKARSRPEWLLSSSGQWPAACCGALACAGGLAPQGWTVSSSSDVVAHPQTPVSA
ncbi:hypothetical protein ABIF65_008571 [Bradyrhizobium japonicum]|uniref:cyclic nucleotide-binding domain-containing protein n=1 Tax=Bradyrhizobium TaxID=374 RepID=UPI0012BCBF76|nr:MULTISPECIES: cyclic nucleotide-binding domain-containing protein [Bradyrhizobium]MBR0882021.1 cyclic nucleotide-binding domain-containing protein [Bradyrhizobium liaoningense]MBR1001188.1 cyclic nucleotide-binding domain-containing protein [Bradyrhizobium liaoningense]MBR1067984.1 cyclic nucleotide-binding domain-containing protein [Bradyrhizobium liaoningense]MCP1962872.1 hypothetical protein [Bradyrhizobium japonicum]WLB98009.1 cyclic nucleotide-binding domain-containing protein [Bradyrh